VIVDSGVEEAAEKLGQLRGITLCLRPDATPAYVQWELSLLFPNGNCCMQ